MINDTMFDNLFIDQHIFDYSEPIDNEDDETLEQNVTINVDVDIDVVNDNDKMIPQTHEFRDVFGSSFVVYHVWALSHKHMPWEFDFEAGQTFSSKNELVNAIKR